MAFETFAPESRIPPDVVEAEHRLIVGESETIDDVIEGMRVGGYSAEDGGRLIMQAINDLHEIAEERVRKSLEADEVA